MKKELRELNSVLNNDYYGLNMINKPKGRSIKKNDNIINNNGVINKKSDISKIKKELKKENKKSEKREEFPKINKKQYNSLDNREKNNEINKINTKNFGIYENVDELNKTKEKENLPKLITESLTGAINLGQTCYMNAGLQNIIHCIPFIN